MLVDDVLYLSSHWLWHLPDVKHENLVFTNFQKVLHRVPTVVFVPEKRKHSFQHISHCFRRVHKGTNLLNIFRSKPIHSRLCLFNERENFLKLSHHYLFVLWDFLFFCFEVNFQFILFRFAGRCFSHDICNIIQRLSHFFRLDCEQFFLTYGFCCKHIHHLWGLVELL